MFSTTISKRKFYSELEKKSLIACVEKYRHILESKVPNTHHSNAYKNEIWLKLTDEFNAIPGVGQCTVKQLHDLYKNMKRRKQYDPEKQKLYFLTFEQRQPETDTGSEKLFLTNTDPDVGVVLQPISSPEDSKDFLKINECEENAPISGHSDSSNTIPSSNATGCIVIDSVASLANVAESSTVAGCSSSAANTDLIANTNSNEELPKNEQPQAKPSTTSNFRTKYLNLYKMKRRLEPSPAKPTANALQNESADRSRGQTEEQNGLVNQKLKAELDAQLNADRRAQEQHDLMIRNLRREERRMIREEKRARREAVRAEKLHALKIRCLEAKIRFFESQLGGE